MSSTSKARRSSTGPAILEAVPADVVDLADEMSSREAESAPAGAPSEAPAGDEAPEGQPAGLPPVSLIPPKKRGSKARRTKDEVAIPGLVVVEADAAEGEGEEARAAARRAQRELVEVRVRRLHRRDLNKTWEFLKLVFRSVNRDTVEYQRPRSKNRFLDVYEEKGEQLIFEVGDQIVGYAECAFDASGADNWINPRYFEKRGMRPLYVDELAVHPDYQGKGVGGFMLDQLQHLARVRGCTHLVLEVAENNEGALSWYRRRNFFKLDAAIFMAQKVPAEPELLPPRKLPARKAAAGAKGKKPTGGARRAPRSTGASRSAKRR